MGKVYLIGAGPGDPGLITELGKQRIMQADCIVYDRLIPMELLYLRKPECELIYVGKRNHHHTMKQEEINQLLIQKGKECSCTVRLKGGDPFVFGRGGEEAIALLQEGIPVEVVPGITSAVAALAYAGIPITHRGVSGGFRVVTAHDKRDSLADLDFTSMAKGRETLVFLMGLSKVDEIADGLLKAGMDKETPAAVVSHGTMPDQKNVIGTLSTLSEELKHTPVESPAIIVVGNVVALSENLSQVAIHRNRRKGLVPKIGSDPHPLAQKLRENGMEITEITVGRIEYLPWKLPTEKCGKIQYMLFTSKNGVRGFFQGLAESGCRIFDFSHCQFCAVGENTARELKKYGIVPDLIAEDHSQKGLWDKLKSQLKPEDTVCYVRAAQVMPWLGEQLRGSEASLIEITVYENKKVIQDTFPAPDDYDFAVFTCGSNAVRVLEDHPEWKKIPAYSIGAATTRALRRCGAEKIRESRQADFITLAEEVMKEWD